MLRKVFYLIVSIGLLVTTNISQAGESPVIVTIGGNIDKSNRSANNEFSDAFLAHHDKSFSSAYEFSYSDLEKLTQKSVKVNAQGWVKGLELQGPSLEELLATVGAVNRDIVLTALDGYDVELSAGDIKAKSWIVAIQSNQQPLAIGGRGPLWLVYDTQGKKATSDEEAKWIWSVFYIEVK